MALTEAALARIAQMQPSLNAFISVSSELALRQAEEADAALAQGRTPGPLHGVPLATRTCFIAKGTSAPVVHASGLIGSPPQRRLCWRDSTTPARSLWALSIC